MKMPQKPALEEMMRQANSSTLPEDGRRGGGEKVSRRKDPDHRRSTQKMYSYIELHFGTSYMDAREQERLNRTDLPWNSCGL